jgi:hypothetical protein
MAYLPKEKIAIEADLYDSSPETTSPTPANRAFYSHVRRLGLDVATIAPIHGRAVAWADFVKFVDRR